MLCLLLRSRQSFLRLSLLASSSSALSVLQHSFRQAVASHLAASTLTVPRMPLWFSAMRRNQPPSATSPPPAPPKAPPKQFRAAPLEEDSEELQPAPRSMALQTLFSAPRAVLPADDNKDTGKDTGCLEYPRAAAGVSRLLRHLQSSTSTTTTTSTPLDYNDPIAKNVTPPEDGGDTLFPTAVAVPEPPVLLPPPPSPPPYQACLSPPAKILLQSGSAPDEETVAICEPDRWEWRMTYADLPSLPQFPTSLLSNSATCASLHIRDLPLETVLARLSDFMRRKSISCDLPLESPGLIRCVTPRHTRFVVLLWKATGGGGSGGECIQQQPTIPSPPPTSDDGTSHDTGKFFPPLVVGVERRQGCCIEMRRLRRLLKEAVEGNTSSSPSSSSSDEAIDRCGSEKMPHFAIGPLVKKLYAQQQIEQRPHHQSGAIDSDKDPQQVPETDNFTIATTSTGASSVASTGGAGPRNRRQQRRRSSLEGLSSCALLLRSPCEDRQRLGLESLAALTDPTAGVDPDTAWDAARVLLQLPADDDDHEEDDEHASEERHEGGDKDGEDQGDESSFASLSLPDDFLAYFSRPDDALRVYPDDDAIESVDLAESSRGAVLHSLALEALGHALEVAVHRRPWRRRRASLPSGIDPTPVGKVPDWDSDFWSTVEQALWHDIGRAVSRPHDAALSAKCLSFLEEWRRQSYSGPEEALSGDSASEKAVLRLRHAHLLPALVQAHRYGAAHHSSLERESRHLLERLTMENGAANGRGGGERNAVNAS